MSSRLFIAIPLPDEVKSFIRENIVLPDNYKKTSSDNLHITLQFLGDVEEERVGEVKNALTAAVKDVNSFSLSVDRLGCFKRDEIPSLIYYTGTRGVGPLKRLAHQLRDKLAPLGFKDRKQFKYHITVGRLKYNRGHYRVPHLSAKIEFKVDRVNLYSSTLTPKGPIYQIISQEKLS